MAFGPNKSSKQGESVKAYTHERDKSQNTNLIYSEFIQNQCNEPNHCMDSIDNLKDKRINRYFILFIFLTNFLTNLFLF